jgi:cytochrome c556
MPPLLRNIAAGTALVLIAAGSTLAFAADEPANMVKYRKNLMGANGAHLGMIAATVKGEISLSDAIALNAQALALDAEVLSANLKQLFPEGSDEAAGLETRALPAIWQNWQGFEAAAMRFKEETAKFAEVAKGGDMAAIAQQVGALGKNGCGACHGDFRKKQS